MRGVCRGVRVRSRRGSGIEGFGCWCVGEGGRWEQGLKNGIGGVVKVLGMRARVFMYAQAAAGTLIYAAGGRGGRVGGTSMYVKRCVRNARQAWGGQSLYSL